MKKDMSWYICDKKNFPWFVAGYDFYPTRCSFSIPSPRLGDRKHTSWIKIISSHKPWEILYLSHCWVVSLLSASYFSKKYSILSFMSSSFGYIEPTNKKDWSLLIDKTSSIYQIVELKFTLRFFPIHLENFKWIQLVWI
jgi:hypothetical protein